MSINDPSLDVPDRPDFRRVGKQVPMVMVGNKMERYRRSSSVGKILDDETGLTDWKLRTQLIGSAQRPDLMAQVSTLDASEKKELRDIAEECLVAGKGTERRTTGTAIHRMLDHIDRGDDWTPAPQFVDACNAYVRMLDEYGLVVADIECQCVNDRFRLAGTMDRRYRTTRQLVAPTGETIPIGSTLAADTKTGESLEYASGTYATQLAAYATSVRYDVRTDERSPFDPPTHQAWGLIVHVNVDDARCDVYWVDLEAGKHGMELADQVREWRRRGDLITPARAPLRAVPTDPAAASMGRHPSNLPASVPTLPPDGLEAPAALLAALDPPAGREARVRAWLRERIATVRTNLDATAMLQRVWPAGVAGLKFDTQTEAEMDLIADALDKVERDHSLPFPSTDPRMPIARIANHPRKELVDQWVAWAPLGITVALCEFAAIGTDDRANWDDAILNELLDGTLRAIGYAGGINDIPRVDPKHASYIMSAAVSIVSGTAQLLYDEHDKPVVRVIAS